MFDEALYPVVGYGAFCFRILDGFRQCIGVRLNGRTIMFHETPDIEVAADQWVEEQKILSEMAAEDARERRFASENPGNCPEIVW